MPVAMMPSSFGVTTCHLATGSPAPTAHTTTTAAPIPIDRTRFSFPIRRLALSPTQPPSVPLTPSSDAPRAKPQETTRSGYAAMIDPERFRSKAPRRRPPPQIVTCHACYRCISQILLQMAFRWNGTNFSATAGCCSGLRWSGTTSRRGVPGGGESSSRPCSSSQSFRDRWVVRFFDVGIHGRFATVPACQKLGGGMELTDDGRVVVRAAAEKGEVGPGVSSHDQDDGTWPPRWNARTIDASSRERIKIGSSDSRQKCEGSIGAAVGSA